MSSAKQSLVALAGVTGYPTVAQVIADFDIGRLVVVNESTDGIVFISFDGTNDAGRLHFTFNKEASWLRQSGVRKVWLRESGAAGACNANVMIEGA